jgi:hypothetical protein
MAIRLTHEDRSGTTYLRPGALPLIVAAICVPVIGAMVLGVVTIGGTGIGLAAGAAVVATLVILAVRSRPGGALEVAPAPAGEGERFLVLALEEVGAREAERIAARAGDAEDVRLLVPLRSRRIDRWLSAEDRARRGAERTLARSAGALVAAGLPVSGSVGDSDAGQALEDELRSYPAAEVIVVGAEQDGELASATSRLDIPIARLEG